MANKLEEALKAWQLQYGVDATNRQRRPHKPVTTYYVGCPSAIRYAQDEYRCQKCGLIWDVDEPRPPCQDTQVQQPQRDRP